MADSMIFALALVVGGMFAGGCLVLWLCATAKTPPPW